MHTNPFPLFYIAEQKKKWMLNGHSGHGDRPLLRSVRYLCFRHRFAAGAGLDVTRKGKKQNTVVPSGQTEHWFTSGDTTQRGKQQRCRTT